MSEENKTMVLLKQELPQLKAVLALNALPGTDVETLALEELEHLRSAALSKPEIYQCEPITVALAVRACLKQNLSLDPYQGLVYIKTRNVNTGTKDSPKWKKALEIMPSANGLISIARQCGRILDVDRPEVEYNSDGKVINVTARFMVPSYDSKMQPSARWVEHVFAESDFKRWQLASHKENGRGKSDMDNVKMNYANPNYRIHNGGIDPEFARAKAIRHGLKKLGTNMNEKRAVAIQSTPQKVMIDPVIAQEETASEITYTEHEEIPQAEVAPAQETKSVNLKDIQL